MRRLASPSFLRYTVTMEPDIVCKPSAFKHGVTLENIRYALADPKYEGQVDRFENKYIVLGFDTAGNLLEIMYNEMGDGGRNVFHAMPCRNMLLHLLDE